MYATLSDLYHRIIDHTTTILHYRRFLLPRNGSEKCVCPTFFCSSVEEYNGFLNHSCSGAFLQFLLQRECTVCVGVLYSLSCGIEVRFANSFVELCACRVQAQVHNNIILCPTRGEFCIRVICSSLLSWISTKS